MPSPEQETASDMHSCTTKGICAGTPTYVENALSVPVVPQVSRDRKRPGRYVWTRLPDSVGIEPKTFTYSSGGNSIQNTTMRSHRPSHFFSFALVFWRMRDRLPRCCLSATLERGCPSFVMLAPLNSSLRIHQ